MQALNYNLDFMILRGAVKGHIDELELASIEEPLTIQLPPEISVSKAIVVNFYIPKDFPLKKINESIRPIYKNAHEDADIIFETTVVDGIPNNKVIYTILFSTSTTPA